MLIEYKELHRYTTEITSKLPLLGIDLGYSAKTRSCGIAQSGSSCARDLCFGECVEYVLQLIEEHGPHVLILEAVLSTYHSQNGNPSIRGEFEKGRGWYHGPGVTTYAAALRFLDQVDQRLSPGTVLPLVEGFLSYKPSRTTHLADAQRLVDEFASAERFQPCNGSEPICAKINGVPEIRRFNAPTRKAGNRVTVS